MLPLYNSNDAAVLAVVLAEPELIERLWKFLKRRSVYSRYHPNYADFRATIERKITQLPITHVTDLASLMTVKFQTFENVSLMAA